MKSAPFLIKRLSSRSSSLLGDEVTRSEGDTKQTKLSLTCQVSEDKQGNQVMINQYRLLSKIARGAHGVVYSAVDSQNNKFAIKVLDKRKLLRQRVGMLGTGLDHLREEIAIQKRLDHPNILPLLEVIDSDEHPRTYLVTNLIVGGSVCEDTLETDPVPEFRRKKIFAQLVSALTYLHAQNIVHKDIKPSNLLSEHATGNTFLIDFGVSHKFKTNETPRSDKTDGTTAFFAPETCTGDNFDAKLADIWATGVTLYVMTYGKPPFISSNPADIFSLIQSQEILFPTDSHGKPVSQELITLLKAILEREPLKRLSLQEIASHPWCQSEHDGETDHSVIHVDDQEMKQAVTSLNPSISSRISQALTNGRFHRFNSLKMDSL